MPFGFNTIAIVDEGKLVPLREWQQFPHVRRGAATNRLRVRCVEALCQFYINDEFTVEITDHTFAAGKVSLWAETFSDHGLDVAFERVRLWSQD